MDFPPSTSVSVDEGTDTGCVHLFCCCFFFFPGCICLNLVLLNHTYGEIRVPPTTLFTKNHKTPKKKNHNTTQKVDVILFDFFVNSVVRGTRISPTYLFFLAHLPVKFCPTYSQKKRKKKKKSQGEKKWEKVSRN